MCGIAGLISSQQAEPSLVRRMTGTIRHRGPDDEGVWVDADAGIALGHRRLSIVDLSPLGHQPMHSADERWVISYNGEIYNHAALRAELEAGRDIAWRGHSDTETLVECIAVWGLRATLEKSVGMFALALWDRKERRLYLARDRFGEKPLYYGWAGGDFVFASELKAIRAHPRFDNAISRTALALFAARTYIPAPFSIYERLFKLPPGCILEVAPEAAAAARAEAPAEGRREGGLALTRYWSYRDVVERGLADPVLDEGEALDGLEQVLAKAIGGQAVADVPVGAFLSGGIDSSTVVALYQKYSPIPVRTFSIGFEEAGFNEAEHARAVARHLGTVHNERIVTVEEAREVIPRLPAMYDEPFADSSQIPTFLVSRFAREQVTVALSGDGGDELFAGYNRHSALPRAWPRLARAPQVARRLIAGGLARIPPRTWNRLRPGRPHFGGKVQKALEAAGARDFDEFCRTFLDEWNGAGPVIGEEGGDRPDRPALEAPLAVRLMFVDAISYLPDDILCKVDRAAMAVSLETRVPFLDHRVAEFSARVPLALKLRGGESKYLLRRLLARELPPALFQRPKAGFAIPVGQWICGPLRDWAENLLDPRRLRSDGYFDATMVERRWRDHLAGRRDSSQALWAILMFQAWRNDLLQPGAGELRACA
ncbi:MAG TPA: asparagine synthase (glutamine-hydrolyzing) [Allosphingosinicella sp.]|jgi:asparagine synthase (glutamine-hydrolysing)|nr:asparagine synthase (glutamine-hydrolyzing) [Allosphingosinicella sp.]